MGQALGGLLQPGDVVALFGELGSGKTVLVRGIAVGLGCAARDVHSPSFTLINEYICGSGGQVTARGQADRRMVHVDLYRIQSEDELREIGWDDAVHRGSIAAVEWAERALRWLPPDYLRVSLETLGGDQRRIRAQATGARSIQIALGWLEAAGLRAEVT